MDDRVSGTVRGAVRSSLGLFTARDRIRFRFVIVAQAVTSILDLVGVLLLALVALILTSVAQDQFVSGPLTNWLGRLGFSDVPMVRLAAFLATAACAFFVAKSVLYTYLLRRIYRFLAARQASIASRMVQELFMQPLGFIERRSTQETAYAIVVGSFSATGGVLGSYAVVVSELALMVLLAGALLWVDVWLSLVALIFFGGIGYFIHRTLSSRMTRYGIEIGETVISGTQILQESVSLFREIQVLGRRRFFVRELSDVLEVNAKARANSLLVSQLPKIIYEIALVVGAVAVAGWQLSTKPVPLAIATLVLFMTAATRLIPSMLRMTSQIMIIKHSAAQAEQTYELQKELETFDSIDEQEKNNVITQDDSSVLEPSIRISSVWARYPGARNYALNDISLNVDPGHLVAVVGATGAGKSTFADVILGVLQPVQGDVLIGHLHPKDVVSRWPGALAYVPQTVGMVNGTVRDNVAIGIPRELVDDQQVWEALEQAHLADFLRAQREGLDTQVGERGVTLSGGQRQRLGLSRALFSHPRLLVLDEATSALDAETEAAITATLALLSGKVTTVVIAHRLATIRHANLIVYLRAGRVAAVGSFDDVRRAVPEFDTQASLLGLSVEG